MYKYIHAAHVHNEENRLIEINMLQLTRKPKFKSGSTKMP